ncbi:zinc-binding dehydrogenase, partial [Streptomyces beijiangensis]
GDEELVRALGADRFVLRDGPLDGGYDGVLDAAVLGAAALAAVRDGGAYAGVIPGASPASERGVRVETQEVAADGELLAELVGLADRGVLTLRVAETYGLEDAAKAHARLQE